MKQQNKHAASKVPNVLVKPAIESLTNLDAKQLLSFQCGDVGGSRSVLWCEWEIDMAETIDVQGKSGSYFVDIKLSILLLASRMLPVIFQCLAMGSMVIYGNQLCSLTPTPHSTPRNHGKTYGISMGISTYFWDHLGRWEQMTRPCVAVSASG